jgi:methionyl-tRNA formyltransferase
LGDGVKILFLGSNPNPLAEWLQAQGEQVVSTAEAMNARILQETDPDLVISYNYRHLIKREILDRLKRPAVNLHISYLPWNRGADPNPWSLLENTPSGVTIHHIDEGIDTGDILFQKRVSIHDDETLAHSYLKLQNEIQALFKENWQAIRQNIAAPTRQSERGTFHTLKDRERFSHCLESLGWNITAKEFRRLYQDRSPKSNHANTTS